MTSPRERYEDVLREQVLREEKDRSDTLYFIGTREDDQEMFIDLKGSALMLYEGFRQSRC